MLVVGLTGSIGMGKTDTAKLFAAYGWPVFDADASVHALYAVGGAAVEPISRRFRDVVVRGAVDRKRLGAQVLGNPSALQALEAIVHPLVKDDRKRFLDAAREKGCEAVVLDIPLLLEQGRPTDVDVVVVVSAPADVQRARVLARPGMTPEKFESIVRTQLSDAQKRALADHVVDTGSGREVTARQVADIVQKLRVRIAGTPK